METKDTFWAIEKYPCKLGFRRNEDGPYAEVEIFGILKLRNEINNSGDNLVVFRENSYGIANQNSIGDIHMLPTLEFQKRYSKFQLKQGDEEE